MFVVLFLAHTHPDWTWVAFSPSEVYRSQAGSQRYETSTNVIACLSIYDAASTSNAILAGGERRGAAAEHPAATVKGLDVGFDP